MNITLEAINYRYDDSSTSHAHAYLLPQVEKLLAKHFQTSSNESKSVFDLGCGNGSVAAHLTSLGYSLVGVDPSEQGIEQANQAYPKLTLRIGSAYDKLADIYGCFPAVISLEVVEHVYSPRDYAKTLFDLTKPGGVAIVSTPYHSYLKNLAMALSGKMDQHFTVLWDHGHIKFWSFRTLEILLRQAGFIDVTFHRAGRFPPLAKSMIAVAAKPRG